MLRERQYREYIDEMAIAIANYANYLGLDDSEVHQVQCLKQEGFSDCLFIASMIHRPLTYVHERWTELVMSRVKYNAR